jgi:hypothetical protein
MEETMSAMKVQNPMCDGSHCVFPDGEVRVYPLGEKGTLCGNLILCSACFRAENAYRVLRARETGKPENFPLVSWIGAEPHPET